MQTNPNRRSQWAWAAYDWANSAFATTVIAGFFPVYFKQFNALGLEPATSTLYLGLFSSLASLLVMCMAPVLGARADRLGAHKRYLLVFTVIGVFATALLPLAGQGDWLLAVSLFALGSVGFFGGLTFYDSLIVQVARPEELDRVSSLGYGAGYLGGGLLFAVNVAMTVNPHWFGLADAGAAVRWSFLSVAVWWTVFALPLFLSVPEARRSADASAERSVFAQLRDTVGELRRHRNAGLFLLAYWLYIDGVHTIIRMAVDFGLALGFPSDSLIKALLMVQFIGFPAAILFGRLGTRYGTRPAIFVALAVYMGVTLAGYRLQTEAQFYAMAAAIGCVQGGIQALSRSYFAALIPAGKAGTWFGLYNMMGKFAAVLGPLAVGATAYLSGDPRLSILSVLFFFVAGGLLLSRVQPPAN